MKGGEETKGGDYRKGRDEKRRIREGDWRQREKTTPHCFIFFYSLTLLPVSALRCSTVCCF